MIGFDGMYLTDREKKITKKEVKKVNKKEYFSLKVVKVKKAEKCKHNSVVRYENGDVHCYYCKSLLKNNVSIDEYMSDTFIGDLQKKNKSKQPKGTWVNGENLDKIKFPCFCRWSDNGWVGMLIKDYVNDEPRYTIARIDRQTKQSETYGSFKDLKQMIKVYDIHILKGKVIIFDEEEEKENDNR